MFTCPTCHSHSFRSTKLQDGSVERECRGQIKEVAQIPGGKNDHTRRSTSTATVMDSFRACTFIWLAQDDDKYGVTPEDGSEQPPKPQPTV